MVGLHPDGLADIYGEDPAAVQVAFAENRSEVLAAPDPLRAVQQCSGTSTGRSSNTRPPLRTAGKLAAVTRELIDRFVDTLVAAGWSQEQARTANVHELASSREEINTMIDRADDLIEEALARSRDRGARFKRWLERLRGGDPAFAEPSVLYSRDLSEWQAAVYLLTGCEQVWSVLGADALADRFHWRVARTR